MQFHKIPSNPLKKLCPLNEINILGDVKPYPSVSNHHKAMIEHDIICLTCVVELTHKRFHSASYNDIGHLEISRDMRFLYCILEFNT